MPRSEIELPYRVEYLSILDEKGHVDTALEPDIPDVLLLKLHKEMLAGRRFDGETHARPQIRQSH